MVRSIHAAVKGRVRFQIDGLYRSNPLKKYLEDRLAEKEEITGFSANFLSGHALVFFDPELSVSAISLLIQEAVRAFHQENGNYKGFVQKKSLYETFFIDPPLSAHKKAPDQGPLEAPAHFPAGPGLLKSTKPKRPIPSRRKTRQMVLRAADQRVEPWHLQSAESLLVEMGIQPQAGLSDQAVMERQKKFGPNILSEAIPRSGFSMFIDQFKSLPVALLGVAAGISVATGGLVDAVVILSVVVINAVIGYVTESQAEKTIHSLKNLIRPMALVIREGSVKTIGSQEVLPGDLLVLQPGSYIAADARRENSRAQHQEHGCEHVGQVVDDVVEQRAVEMRDAPAHLDQAGKRAVTGVDRGRDRHRDKARAKITARGVIDRDQTGDCAERRV